MNNMESIPMADKDVPVPVLLPVLPISLIYLGKNGFQISMPAGM